MKATTILAFLFLICAALPLYAADINDLTYDASGATVIITDCDIAASGALVIPDTIEGKAVTAIGFQPFRSCTSLTGITLPDSVTSIGGLGLLGLHQPDQHHFQGKLSTRQHRGIYLQLLQQPDWNHAPRQRHQHRGFGLLLLHQRDWNHAPRQRHQHREQGLPWLQYPGQHHHPRERHQHRE